MCKFIWEWIYAKQIALRDTWGSLGVLGVKHSKVWRSCRTTGLIGTKFGTWLRIRQGMDIGSIQFAPQYPRGHFGGFRGSQIQKYVEAVKRLDRLAPNLAHMCRFIWEWIYAKQIALRDTRGQWGVLGGRTFKTLEKLSNGWTDWHQLCFTSADSSGNGHRLNTSRPTIPQGAFGGFRGSQIQMSGEAVKLLDLLAPNLVHVCGFVWEWT